MGTALILEYYKSQWGEPSRAATFENAELDINIYKWPADSTGKGVAIYATAGVSADRKGHNHADELLVGINPECDDIASSLADLGAEIRRTDTQVEHGSTWQFGWPLWEGTDMDSFLALHQQNVLPPLTLPSGIIVQFRQIVPVYRSEVRYKIDKGLSVLMNMWRSQQIPFWDPRRSRFVQ